jgi:hypothetical protein
VLLDSPLETHALKKAFTGIDLGYLKPLDERIVAAIIGVAIG